MECTGINLPFQTQVTSTMRQSIFIFTYELFEEEADDCEQGITTSDEIIDDLKLLKRLLKTWGLNIIPATHTLKWKFYPYYFSEINLGVLE